MELELKSEDRGLQALRLSIGQTSQSTFLLLPQDVCPLLKTRLRPNVLLSQRANKLMVTLL